MTTTPDDADVVTIPRQQARPSVVRRVTDILEAFLERPDGLLLQELMKRTGLPRSTAFRMLRQLIEVQWLEHDADGYRLGTRLLDIGYQAQQHEQMRSAAADALNQLHLATGAVAHLGVLENSNVRYLDKVGPAAASSVPSVLGARVPANRTAAGRALLASLTPEQVDTVMGRSASGEQARGRGLDRLHAHLNWIRRKQGLAFADSSRCPLGIGAVAAPIVGPNGMRGAISLAGHALQLEYVAPAVAAAAKRTAHALSAGGPGGHQPPSSTQRPAG